MDKGYFIQVPNGAISQNFGSSKKPEASTGHH